MDKTESKVKEEVVLTGEEYFRLLKHGEVEDDETIIRVPEKERLPVMAEIIDA